MLFRVVLLGCLALLSFDHAEAVMSKAQLKQTMKTVRNMCLPKSGATKDAVNKLSEGEFEGADRNVMCYLSCLLRMMQAVKNNKINISLIRNQLTKMVEPELGRRMLAAFENCEGTTGEDDCQLSFNFAKCLFEADSDVYVLP